jgi:hypothetical protein
MSPSGGQEAEEEEEEEPFHFPRFLPSPLKFVFFFPDGHRSRRQNPIVQNPMLFFSSSCSSTSLLSSGKLSRTATSLISQTRRAKSRCSKRCIANATRGGAEFRSDDFDDAAPSARPPAPLRQQQRASAAAAFLSLSIALSSPNVAEAAQVKTAPPPTSKEESAAAAPFLSFDFLKNKKGTIATSPDLLRGAVKKAAAAKAPLPPSAKPPPAKKPASSSSSAAAAAKPPPQGPKKTKTPAPAPASKKTAATPSSSSTSSSSPLLGRPPAIAAQNPSKQEAEALLKKERDQELKKKEAEAEKARAKAAAEKAERDARNRAKEAQQKQQQALIGGGAAALAALVAAKWQVVLTAVAVLFRNIGGPSLVSAVLR